MSRKKKEEIEQVGASTLVPTVDPYELPPETPKLLAYANTKFTGHWPVGVSAVVFAADKKAATQLLNAQLHKQGLVGDAREEDMVALDLHTPNAVVLQLGNY